MEMTEYRLLNVVKFTDNEVKAKRLEAMGYEKVEPKVPAKKATTKKEG
ncbi:TPA: hypothetical protein ACGO46_001620 [Streptococcus suis]